MGLYFRPAKSAPENSLITVYGSLAKTNGNLSLAKIKRRLRQTLSPLFNSTSAYLASSFTAKATLAERVQGVVVQERKKVFGLSASSNTIYMEGSSTS